MSPELARMERERVDLEQQLPGLPTAPAVHPSERIGWHSLYLGAPEAEQWVDLRLGRPQAVDAVVLIAPPPGGATTKAGYGFPKRFRVEATLADDEQDGADNDGLVVLADYTQQDFPNPGNLPVWIPVGGRVVKELRITATRLYTEGGRSFVALGEVMVMQGKRNLGPELEAVGPDRVKARSSQGTRPDWGRINLVDGHTVLGPPLGHRASPALGFRSKPASESLGLTRPWVMVDLGEVVPVDEVRLFPAHPPAFAHSPGYGFPVRYHLELRLDQTELPEYLAPPQSGSYTAPPGDNVVTLVGDGRRARFVRLNVDEPHVSNGSAVFALAELQVWSGGQNVALGRPVTSSDSTEAEGWEKGALVDGYASVADIVDWPDWLEGLSKRRELEQQLAALAVLRGSIVQRWQRAGLLILGGLAAAAVMAMVGWNLRQRQLRRSEMEALRERISQDLHDEIGSSLGSIALISQDALAMAPDDDLRRELQEIRDTAQQTLDSMRDIVRLAQSGVYGQGDLTAHLREIADRMLRGIPHEWTSDPTVDRAFNALPMNQRRDLVLMFKETLHNIMRHARATRVQIHLTRESAMVEVSVQDNGCGFAFTAQKPGSSANGSGMGLSNLQRRAAKHGGRTLIDSTPGQGTHIRLRLPLS
ncbi:sensor histidine kinase [Verrucomicrobium sp. BvORR106]|uniref:sensor histidine kinase n=1 Tax=Verrucomicrobium sp. BvORR106 TaxID=1403819 RepID=UPI000AC0F227|nr:sensor histidine kinase [Verrucomicrobium sp. BvORR106]